MNLYIYFLIALSEIYGDLSDAKETKILNITGKVWKILTLIRMKESLLNQPDRGEDLEDWEMGLN